jgi:hypothetical protein
VPVATGGLALIHNQLEFFNHGQLILMDIKSAACFPLFQLYLLWPVKCNVPFSVETASIPKYFVLFFVSAGPFAC